MRRLARFLLVAGPAGVVGGLSKLHASVVAPDSYDFTSSSRFLWAMAYLALLVVTAYGSGLPDVPRTWRAALGASVAATTAAALAISMLQLVVGDALLPRFVVFGSAILLVPWYLLCFALARGGRIHDEQTDRVVLVSGGGTDVEGLRSDLAMAPEHAAALVGAGDLHEVSAGGGRKLVDLVDQSGATVVVLDRDAQADEAVVAQAAELHERGVRVRTLSLFYEQWLGKLPVSELERISLMFDIGEVHRARYGRVKRLLDIALALVVAVPFVVAIPLVFAGNLAFNRGPLFFRQDRVGKGGADFRIWKFRTMRPETSEGPGQWTAEDDPRITPFGRVLRVSHLDELPQVLNVLGGNLSFVGPRPEQPHYVIELAAKLPFYDLRHAVRPGITGWAQVKYGYAGDERDALEKLQYDFYYLRHQSLAFDLRIIGRTLRSVMRRGGR